MQLAAPRACLLLAAALAAAPAEGKVVVDFKAGEHKLGVYWPGDVEVTPTGLNPDFEQLVDVLAPGTSNAQTTVANQHFIVRTTDLKFRAKVSVYESTESDRAVRPYKVEFKNIMFDDPPVPMELKSSTSGYTWIEPGQVSTHSTDIRHDFTIRDSKHSFVVTVRLDSAR